MAVRDRTEYRACSVNNEAQGKVKESLAEKRSQIAHDSELHQRVKKGGPRKKRKEES